MSKNSILILSSSLGGGHQSAAKAIEQIIHLNWPDAIIKTVDTSPPLGSAIYRFLSNYLTDIFVENWHNFNTETAAKLLHLLYTPIALSKISPVLNKFRPRLIIATHAFSSEAIDIALKNLGMSIPLIVVVVDPFSIHHAWTVYKQAQQYWLPNTLAQKLFIRRGINQSRLLVTGHPIRLIDSALINTDVIHLKKSLGLKSEKLTIFMGGNGEGIGRFDQIVSQLLKYKSRLLSTQLIISCGKNKSLFNYLKTLSQRYPQLIFPFGFTDKIYDLIKASDIVIGKPGPNLMFETISLGKPFLTTGLPLGQEFGNYRFISREKLGLVSFTPRQTVQKILKIINDPKILLSFQPAIINQQRYLKQTPRRCIGALRPFLQN